MPTSVVAILSFLRENRRATSAISTPASSATFVAAAAAWRTSAGAGCQPGGPRRVKSPIHNGLALMIPTFFDCRYGISSSKVSSSMV